MGTPGVLVIDESGRNRKQKYLCMRPWISKRCSSPWNVALERATANNKMEQLPGTANNKMLFWQTLLFLYSKPLVIWLRWFPWSQVHIFQLQTTFLPFFTTIKCVCFMTKECLDLGMGSIWRRGKQYIESFKFQESCCLHFHTSCCFCMQFVSSLGEVPWGILKVKLRVKLVAQ